jgi:hypothetical protein
LEESRRLYERAVRHQTAAVKIAPRQGTYGTFLRNHYWNWTGTLVALGDHTEAARTAARLPGVMPEGWEEYSRAACFLAACIPLAATDRQLSNEERERLARAYGDQAVQLLRQAIDRGYRDIADLKRASILQPLRGRADFRELLAELEAPKKP